MADRLTVLENRVTNLESVFKAMVAAVNADDAEPDNDNDDQKPPQVPPEGSPS